MLAYFKYGWVSFTVNSSISKDRVACQFDKLVVLALKIWDVYPLKVFKRTKKWNLSIWLGLYESQAVNNLAEKQIWTNDI